MSGLIALLYGGFSYVVFLVTFVYAVGFVADIGVPKTIDSGAASSLATAVFVNLLLLTVFTVQHSVMARPAFKGRWTRFVPKSVERSTYVLAASLALALLFWQWRPLSAPVWQLHGPGADLPWLLYALGWAIVLLSTFLISHAHLFGLRQVYDRLLRRSPQDPPFQINGLYRYLRHPIMAGFIVAFWSAPYMSWGRMLFAAVATGYILVALRLEERDLIRYFGARYRDYRARVPMLIPRPRRTGEADESHGTNPRRTV